MNLNFFMNTIILDHSAACTSFNLTFLRYTYINKQRPSSRLLTATQCSIVELGYHLSLLLVADIYVSKVLFLQPCCSSHCIHVHWGICAQLSLGYTSEGNYYVLASVCFPFHKVFYFYFIRYYNFSS